MKKHVSLWALLSIILVATILLTNTLLYGSILYINSQHIQKEEGRLLLATGKQLASEAPIKSTLLANRATAEVTTHTNNMTENYNFDFIVLLNMQGIRLTHPNQAKIGQPFQGGDEKRALSGHQYTSISRGTLGTSLRGFVPVFDQGKQIGVVALGIKMTTLQTLIQASRSGYILSLLISSGIGLITATLVAYYLKRQLLNLEPQEISRLLEERNAMLNETKDIVVVTDNQDNITLANNAAKTFYQQLTNTALPLEGQPLQFLLPDKAQIDSKRQVEQLYRQNGQDYLFYRAPIVVRQQIVGAIIFLRNATESLFVMDQLANTTAYASALQSQSHEFMNKLHIIYGLVDLEAYTELKIYLNDILKPAEAFTHNLAILVENPLIAGFLVGEQEKFAEAKLNLQFEISTVLPNNANQDETIAVINVLRYIHHVLLQNQLSGDIILTLRYQDNALSATYVINAALQQPAPTQAFQENYFKVLLADAGGHFQITQQPPNIHLALTTNYKGVIK
ncbi:MAG: sensor histidine kinase [Lactobacillus sp.]|jgi:two-component system CitB family sensor kinase|nr:sensor histidine kinase [Lactobacillus sp.]